jgi:FkbM family methyltransferase
VTEPFVSYAQHGEDVVLWRALGGDAPRFYIDVGAYDPSQDSVTRALYERGWRGINIEPLPERIAAFERDRPEDVNLCLAIGATDGRATLHVPDVPGWATLDEGIASDLRARSVAVEDIEVDVRTLDGVLRAQGVTTVDVLKIDVEGNEPDVIRGVDLTRVRPTVIVVEGVAPEVGRRAGDEAVALLRAAGYTHCMFDGLNHYLTCDPALVDALSVPANPFDAYVRAAVAPEPAADAVEQATAADERDAGEPPPPDPLEALRAAYPAVRHVPADERRARRRAAVTQLLRRPPDPAGLADTRRRPTDDLAARLADAVAERDPELLIAGIYRVVLRREAEPDGIRSWQGVLASGVAPIEIARIMAESPEALLLGEANHAALLTAVDVAAALASLRELARPAVGTAAGELATASARAVLVHAVYDVCLGRAPTAAELIAETARLAGGYGRDRFIALFARHPESWRRNLRSTPDGFTGRVVRRLGRRRATGIVRARVRTAELRRTAALGLIAAEALRAGSDAEAGAA